MTFKREHCFFIATIGNQALVAVVLHGQRYIWLMLKSKGGLQDCMYVPCHTGRLRIFERFCFGETSCHIRKRGPFLSDDHYSAPIRARVDRYFVDFDDLIPSAEGDALIAHESHGANIISASMRARSQNRAVVGKCCALHYAHKDQARLHAELWMGNIS
ncbi:hypothetical protein BJV82DRAFT_576319 [Fennellomyces sp. T-0311]|nr:hypothetical protein BJV82DRAFT_576319 [Fennellomyces sp. T-0311]